MGLPHVRGVAELALRARSPSAREKVRVARALDGLPLVGAEFGKGRLSYSKVRALTRVATPENEKSLVDVALGATAAHWSGSRAPTAVP